MTRAALLALIAFVASGSAAAEVYKWVDEKGVTQYSESPPPDGKATKVQTAPAPVPAKDASANWKDKELDSRRSRIEREQSEDHARRKAEHDTARRTNRCIAARRELKLLQEQRPIYEVNPKGERVYLADKDRPAEIEAARRAVAANCD